MSKRPARDGPSPGNPANIKLDAVNPLWLRVSEEERYGHLRVVLLPIVYNAMSQRESLRATGLFQALHRTIQASTYRQLVQPAVEATQIRWDANDEAQPLFRGPRNLQACARKYMCTIQDSGEWGLDRGRRSFMSNPLQQGDSFSNSEGGGEGAQPSASLQSPNGVPKGANLRPISTGRFAALDGDAAKAAGEARDIARQLAAVQATLEQTRQEVLVLKSCLVQVYGILLDQPGQLGASPPAPRPVDVTTTGPGYALPPAPMGPPLKSLGAGLSSGFYNHSELPQSIAKWSGSQAAYAGGSVFQVHCGGIA
ncbi:hypothetical protein QBZ16_004681 [Prototheca wickerhamii]|uniref:Uncharacterized protein n=1 Tax=Prototheca wickerhamii TaxID=3111 RepID=A0AAD9IHT8_PROWI|nr:hypothetical protein QBZ16_004681 [Prototheca wickerhamii]